jgi:hypothetical protein
LRETELTELTQALPGAYDNTEQARADAEKGIQPAHEALALQIVALENLKLGHHAFYAQEMAADDPRRVMSQKVLTFAATDHGVVEQVWTLTEPRRWRDGYADPELFRSLVQNDLRLMEGCELKWKKVEARFIGTNDPKKCSVRFGAGGAAQLDTRMELGKSDLATAELAYGADGALVQGRSDEPFYRFRKQGQ